MSAVSGIKQSIAALESLPTGLIVLVTSDQCELTIDKEILALNSRVFQDMLSACDTPKLQIVETRESMTYVLEVMQGGIPAGTYDTRSSACWNTYKDIMLIADKYDMMVVKERCEKMLISRCLRGRVRCGDFRFQDIAVGMEWLHLCKKYSLKDLGWYVAYDLGTQLATGKWRQPILDACRELQDHELLQIIIEAMYDSVQARGLDDAAEAAVLPAV